MDPREKLKALHNEIWKHIPRTRNSYGVSIETRRLTEEEWDWIKETISSENLICQPHNACMGFGLGMTLYAEPPVVYPGADLPPEYLITITQKHIPFPGSVDDVNGPRFNEAWDIFSPITHTSENGAKLKMHKSLEPLKPKGHYDY